MAPSSNYISFLFLTTLLFALQITVRDSQFFSKVTHFDKDNVKVTELPNKEAPEVNKPEQQPPFIPETENSYGLYGHHDESNQVPSTTPTSYHPYKTEFENSNNKYYNNDAYNTRFSETSYNNNNNKYYNKDSYEGNQYELSDTKYTEEGYNNKYHNSYQNNYNNDAANDKYSYNNNNNNNKNYNAHNNRYNTYNSNAVSRYNGERQGMSDTRFLEGGKYFYDVGTEMYNPTNYGDSSREVNTNNWYNNRGVNYNGYQNQEEFEDEHENFEP